MILVRDGVADEAALRGTISQGDLAEGLRMEQIERLEELRLATLEAGGKIGVVPSRSTAT